MTDTLAAVSQSLSADVRRLDTISQNVANTSTPGYRAERATVDFATQLGAATNQLPTLDSQASAGALPFAPGAIDQRDGPLAQTGRPLDMALRGPGFFVVQHDGGELLVRAGNFRLDRNARLVTAAGDPALGADGAEIILREMPVRIDADGSLHTGETQVGQLKLVATGPQTSLQPSAGGYLYRGELGEWRGEVAQGALEHSNVDAAEQTVRLMELTRHVESVQRAISIYDKAMDTGINHLGEN